MVLHLTQRQMGMSTAIKMNSRSTRTQHLIGHRFSACARCAIIVVVSARCTQVRRLQRGDAVIVNPLLYLSHHHAPTLPAFTWIILTVRAKKTPVKSAVDVLRKISIFSHSVWCECSNRSVRSIQLHRLLTRHRFTPFRACLFLFLFVFFVC